MKAYSLDLRERIVQALVQGNPKTVVAGRFAVSYSTVRNYARRVQRTGSVAPTVRFARQPLLNGDQQAALTAQLTAQNDLTLTELAAWTAQTFRVRPSLATLSRLVRRLGWTFKKSLAASERNEPARAAFRAHIAAIAPDDLVAVDETASTIALSRRSARAPQAHRAQGTVPKNDGISTTVITTLTAQGFGPAISVRGACDSAVFHRFVRDFLAPTLRPGQVVVFDNLAAHKTAAVTDLIEARGCQVLYLPPYSPDFNPIELAFAKLKAFSRRVGARTQEALDAALPQALDTVTPVEARAFIRHCGYRSLALSP
jgi:transposase